MRSVYDDKPVKPTAGSTIRYHAFHGSGKLEGANESFTHELNDKEVSDWFGGLVGGEVGLLVGGWRDRWIT